MEKGWILIISGIITIVLSMYFIILQNESTNPIFLAPPEIGISEIPLSIDCSGNNIPATWDSIFQESSSGISIVNNQNCDNYLVYKEANSLLYLMQIIKTFENNKNITKITAIYGNFTQQYINTIKNITSSSDFQMPASPLLVPIQYLNQENITSSNADSKFRQVFKISPAQWSENTAKNIIFYEFSQSQNNLNESRNLSAKVSANYSLEYIALNSIQQTITQIQLPICIPNWTAVNTSCINNNIITWFNDTKSCNNFSNLPLNITIPCNPLIIQIPTSNITKIIGNISDIVKNLNIDIYVDSNPLNLTENYSNLKKVEFKENNILRINLTYNFSSQLNLSNIKIEKQAQSSNFGYMIVNGLNINKTLIIDRLNSSSTKVCAKNTEITSISEISQNCDGANEYIINCPGSNSSLSCVINNNQFVISGLDRSAAKEILPSPTTNNNIDNAETNCTSQWNCTAWGSCLNKMQTRTCSNITSCYNQSQKPEEVKTCSTSQNTNLNQTSLNSNNNPSSMPPACTSNWNCSNWTTCSSNSTQTRICTDINKCISSTKPSENQACKYNPKISTTVIVVLIAISLVLLIGIFVIVYFIIKSRSSNTLPIPVNTTKINPYVR